MIKRSRIGSSKFGQRSPVVIGRSELGNRDVGGNRVAPVVIRRSAMDTKRPVVIGRSELENSGGGGNRVAPVVIEATICLL